MTAAEIPPGTELRGFSSAERTLDTAALAGLRPVPSPLPRRPAARTFDGEVTGGRLCPICKAPFFDFDEFAEHVWDETPAYIAGIEKEAQQWREFEEWAEELDGEPRMRVRKSVRSLLATQPGLTTKQVAVALGCRGQREIWLESELARMAGDGELASPAGRKRQRWYLPAAEEAES